MADPETTPVPDAPTANPPAADGLTETEVKTLVSAGVSEALSSDERLKKLDTIDLDAFRAGILEDVTGLFATNKTTPLDEASLTKTIGSVLDSKLAGLGGITKRVGPLSRWLTGG